MSNDPNPDRLQCAYECAITEPAHFLRALQWLVEYVDGAAYDALGEAVDDAAHEAADQADTGNDITGEYARRIAESIGDDVERNAPKRVEDAIRTILLLWPEVSATTREARAKAEAECRELRDALAKGLAMMEKEKAK